ncbi:MAG: type I-A CRISPR-associated protein Cas4/Csa1 [bacterium]|nr:type I-A CRISPR-associated protein Cas4/Csa1 [bacterium]
MYYFSEVEFMKLRKLIQESYTFQIDEQFRGWNWDKPDLSPPFSNIYISAWELASPCPVYRDVVLRRVYGVKLPTTQQQVLGFFVHKLLQKIFGTAKRELYNGADNLYSRLRQQVNSIISASIQELKTFIEQAKLNQEQLHSLGRNILLYEIARINAKVEEIKVNYPTATLETLVFRAVPVNTEIVVDGSLLGFSRLLRVDALGSYGNIVFEVKLGRPTKRHRLQVAAYALCIEANYFVPINVGVIVYVNINGEKFTAEKDIFAVDENLRAEVVSVRDELLKLLHDRELPPPPSRCPSNCLLREQCAAH